jgi:hypothetical protein
VDRQLLSVFDTVGGEVGRRSVEVVKPGGIVIELTGVDPATQAAADEAGVRTVYHAVHTDATQLAAFFDAEDLAGSTSHDSTTRAKR